jgi:hypothetical protein
MRATQPPTPTRTEQQRHDKPKYMRSSWRCSRNSAPRPCIQAQQPSYLLASSATSCVQLPEEQPAGSAPLAASIAPARTSACKRAHGPSQEVVSKACHKQFNVCWALGTPFWHLPGPTWQAAAWQASAPAHLHLVPEVLHVVMGVPDLVHGARDEHHRGAHLPQQPLGPVGAPDVADPWRRGGGQGGGRRRSLPIIGPERAAATLVEQQLIRAAMLGHGQSVECWHEPW